MEILKQQISNHPLFGNVKRKIVVYDIHISTKFKQIVLEADMEYFEEGTDKKIENTFISTVKDWVINNSTYTIVRDENGVAVKNPNYKPAPMEGEEDLRTSEEKGEYLAQPSFSYFINRIKDGADLISLLRLHILEADKIKYFDKLLK